MRERARVGKDGVEVFRAVLVCGREFCPRYKIVSSCVVRGAAYDEFIPSLHVLTPLSLRIIHAFGWVLPFLYPQKNLTQCPFSWLPNTGDHGREPAVVVDSSYDPVQLSPPIGLL